MSRAGSGMSRVRRASMLASVSDRSSPPTPATLGSWRRRATRRSRFEIADCDLKHRTWRPALRALRLHRARRRDALQRPAQQARGRRQRRDHARLRRATPRHGLPRRDRATPLSDPERETEAKLGQHDQQLSLIFRALRQLISPPPRPKRPIGFGLPEEARRQASETIGKSSHSNYLERIARARRGLGARAPGPAPVIRCRTSRTAQPM
jgi:hypothetical protein